MHCFHLKMADKEVERYTQRLQLLAQGKLTEAAAVTTGGGKAVEAAKGMSQEESEAEFDAHSLKGHVKSSSHGLIRPAPLDGECCSNRLLLCMTAPSLTSIVFLLHEKQAGCSVVASFCLVCPVDTAASLSCWVLYAWKKHV